MLSNPTVALSSTPPQQQQQKPLVVGQKSSAGSAAQQSSAEASLSGALDSKKRQAGGGGGGGGSAQQRAKQQVLEETRLVKDNWRIQAAYVREDWEGCLALCEQALKESRGQCVHALYIKGLILRQKGLVDESLPYFQQATVIEPTNVQHLKQVARSLFLLGKHREAIEVYDEAQRQARQHGVQDWEVHHNRGLCYLHLKEYKTAAAELQLANGVQRHDSTYVQLGRVYTLDGQYQLALQTYLEAKDFSPENTELLTTIGLLYLRTGDTANAFTYLGNSLTLEPRDARTILAAGSILQDHNDADVALMKYRVAAQLTPDSAQLWNNIGMCFFDKQKFVACIACLKRAIYLDPFEWIIAYNLGLAHLSTGQWASAFHFLSACINLKPDFAAAYMYLGLALVNLNDFENAWSAYERSLQLDAEDHLCELNYTISLLRRGETDRARHHFQKAKALFAALDEQAQQADADVVLQMKEVRVVLGEYS